MGLIDMDRGWGFQDRIDDSPSLFDIILSCEQRRVTCHSITQNPLVGLHLFRTWMAAGYQLYRLPAALPSRR
jgi:hypothetical protein